MVIERATCGHYAAFDLDGAVLVRICDCPNLAQPRTSGPAVQRAEAQRCEKCGSARTGSGPHSPHWRGGRLVDCAGEAVPR